MTIWNAPFAAIAFNDLNHVQALTFPLRDVGITDGISIHSVFCTTNPDFLETDEQIGHVSVSQFQISMEAPSATMILPRKS